MAERKKYLSPGQRAWLRFKSNRRGYVSLWIFGFIFVFSLFAEVLCNDKPLVVYYNSSFYFPVLKAYPETTFGGDFKTEADYADDYIHKRITSNGNWIINPPDPYSYNTINFDSALANPAPPSSSVTVTRMT